MSTINSAKSTASASRTSKENQTTQGAKTENKSEQTAEVKKNKTSSEKSGSTSSKSLDETFKKDNVEISNADDDEESVSSLNFSALKDNFSDEKDTESSKTSNDNNDSEKPNADTKEEKSFFEKAGDGIKDTASKIKDGIQDIGEKIEDTIKNQIRIKGTDGDDNVKVNQTEDGSLTVNINGKETTYSKEDAERLLFDLGEGNNTLSADDTVKYGLNVKAGDGNNDIKTGSGNDKINLGNGDNKISAGNGSNDIIAGDGNNEVSTTNNSLFGSMFGEFSSILGSDIDVNSIKLGNGDNTVTGGAGKDNVTAGDGNNKIDGGSGDDCITAGKGNNEINGGLGDDTITTDKSGIMSIFKKDGNNKIDGGAGSDKITVGNGNNDILGGDEGFHEEIVNGLKIQVPGGDIIKAGNGDNTIKGGAGNDIIKVGNGNNNLEGGDEDGTHLEYKDGEWHEVSNGDNITAGNGDNKIFGGTGDDKIKAGNGNNTIYGGDEARIGNDPHGDIISVGTGDNKIFGGAGVDTINTGGGKNEIYDGGENGPINPADYGSIDGIKDKNTIRKMVENPDFLKILENRYDNADTTAKALYDQFKDKIKVSDIDTQETARYQSFGGDVTVNISEDAKDRPSAGTTYYHEVGHLMDDQIKNGQGNGYASDSEKFGNALKTDFDNYVNKYMEDNGITDKNQAYSAIGKMMNGPDCDKYRGVSDVYGGLSENQARGAWGHDNKYWNGNDKAVNHEAFANMFEVAMGGDKDALKHMQEMLPTAYAEFLTMAEGAIQ